MVKLRSEDEVTCPCLREALDEAGREAMDNMGGRLRAICTIRNMETKLLKKGQV